jgi:DnaK suppressor protein
MSTGTSFSAVRNLLADGQDARHGDMADQATGQMGNIETTIAVVNSTRAEIVQRSLFLERQIRGEHDICYDCGSEIPPARRKAVPTAIRCCSCQSKLD